MSPSLNRWSASFLCTLGLGLSLHLALLKFFALPCLGSGGCHSIIFSQFGTVFRLPVGLYGALLWLAAILVGEPTKRASLLLLLSLGSVGFMCIQFFVLRGFCLYCTLHAVTSWLALAFHRGTPTRWAAPLGLAVALGGFAVARAHAGAKVETSLSAFSSRAPLATAPTSVIWLAPLAPNSPGLVISLNCAACLDLLEELSRQRYGNIHSGPGIFFKTTEENRELTTVFVAAVLAQPGEKRESFLGVTAMLLSLKDQALSSPNEAAAKLAAIFPNSAAQRENAIRLLAAQSAALTATHVGDTTPLIIPLGERPRAVFKVDELFGR